MIGFGRWLDLKGKEEEEVRVDIFIKFRERWVDGVILRLRILGYK